MILPEPSGKCEGCSFLVDRHRAAASCVYPDPDNVLCCKASIILTGSLKQVTDGHDEAVEVNLRVLSREIWILRIKENSMLPAAIVDDIRRYLPACLQIDKQ